MYPVMFKQYFFFINAGSSQSESGQAIIEDMRR